MGGAGHHLFHTCGESEEAGPRTEKDEAGVWREQLLSTVGPEREPGRGLLISVAPQIVIQFHIRLEAFTPIIFIERTSCI